MSSSNSGSTIARSEPHTLVHFHCIADVILVDTLISWFAGKVKPSTIYSTTLITSLVSALDYCGVETHCWPFILVGTCVAMRDKTKHSLRSCPILIIVQERLTSPRFPSLELLPLSLLCKYQIHNGYNYILCIISYDINLKFGIF